MDRRNFLRRAGALGIPLLTGVPGVRAAGSSILTSLLPPDSDKVLVLVQLAGGNDGLNTLIPTDQLGALQAVRQNIFMPASTLQPLTNSLSFHGRMGGMRDLYNMGKLSIIQDVGYPNQNRSHFRSTDIWTTASSANEELETGWIGRHLDVHYPNFPAGYPENSGDAPPAISMGNVANATCQGLITNMSQTVNNPDDATTLTLGGDTPVPNDNYGDELSFLRVAIEQTNEYSDAIRSASSNGFNMADYPGGRFAEQLANVAKLIKGGLSTSVYVVTLGGFDTHDTQTNSGSNTSGRHADLLGELSDGIAAFQEDLEMLGLDQRVLGMTFSEFGRRIKSNGSRGTDHGTAAPMFVFGTCASSDTILGDNPTIDPNVGPNTGVPMQYDFRDVYGSVLVDWFEVSEADVRSLLYPGFVRLPVADGCANLLPVALTDFTATGLDKTIQLSWQTQSEDNNTGFEVERSSDGREFRRIGWVPAVDPAGGNVVRDYELEDANVNLGPLYYYRLKQIDTDGTFAYSAVRTARLAGAGIGEWSFGQPFPNPVVDETTVQVYAPVDGRVSYTLFAANGQRILSDSATVYGRTDNRLTVRVGRIPAGMYTLRFTAGDGKYTNRKLVVR